MRIYVYIIIYVLFFLSFLYSCIQCSIIFYLNCIYIYIYTYNDTAFIMIPTYFIFISIVYCIYMFSLFFKLTTLREINCMQFIRFIVNKQRL